MIPVREFVGIQDEVLVRRDKLIEWVLYILFTTLRLDRKLKALQVSMKIIVRSLSNA